MKFIAALIIVLAGFTFAFGQNELAPVVERDVDYRDWTYSDLNGVGKTTLSSFASGKKLVMVVYWAPWCPNWKHDVAFVQELHNKYSSNGLAVIGVGEYDKPEKMRAFAAQYGMTFPNVFESESLAARETTVHNTHRRKAGDTRKWGSPWYVFLDPATFTKGSDILAARTNVVNGELVKEDTERFIRTKLGLKDPASAAPKSNGVVPGARGIVKP